MFSWVTNRRYLERKVFEAKNRFSTFAEQNYDSWCWFIFIEFKRWIIDPDFQANEEISSRELRMRLPTIHEFYINQDFSTNTTKFRPMNCSYVWNSVAVLFTWNQKFLWLRSNFEFPWNVGIVRVFLWMEKYWRYWLYSPVVIQITERCFHSSDI